MDKINDSERKVRQILETAIGVHSNFNGFFFIETRQKTVVFINLEKAFDMINWELLFVSMKKR